MTHPTEHTWTLWEHKSAEKKTMTKDEWVPRPRGESPGRSDGGKRSRPAGRGGGAG